MNLLEIQILLTGDWYSQINLQIDKCCKENFKCRSLMVVIVQQFL